VPELPEVETIANDLAGVLLGQPIVRVFVAQCKLRLPVVGDLQDKLVGRTFLRISRRGKYLLFFVSDGSSLIIHLGMSGRLLIKPEKESIVNHQHVTLVFGNGLSLRFIDPRKFGLVVWHDADPESHPLLAKLGPEPLEEDFGASYLYGATSKRRVPIKNLLMNSAIVAGIGNIYANEILFAAKIAPQRLANKLSLEECAVLVQVTRQILLRAIEGRGTTIRDYVSTNNVSGAFQHKLKMYGRAGLPCLGCGGVIQYQRLGQRSTFFCERCQL
jgi:formamidopyrimidine-DNA glycosylase